jgi:integrase
MKRRITQKLVDELEPGDADFYVSDEGLIGFRLKVTPAGRKVLFFQYRSPSGQQRKITYKTPRVDEARKRASAAAAAVRDGKDPLTERDRLAGTPSLAGAFELFEAEYVAEECKPSTADEYHRMFAKYVPARIKKRNLATVSRTDLVGVMRSLAKKPAQARNLIKMLAAFFSWCEGDGQLLPKGSNPTHDIKRAPDVKRRFVFEPDQLRRFAQALDKSEKLEWPSAIRAIRLLLFTGMRKQEVLQLTWPQVDIPGRRIRLTDSKTGARDVPLGKAAIAVLEDALAKRAAFPSDYVFPSPRDRKKPIVGFQKIWERVRARAEMPELRVHDLRHNYGGMGAASTRSAVHVKGLLGHSQLATTDRYMELADAPLSQAADTVNEVIAEQMRPRSGRARMRLVRRAFGGTANGPDRQARGLAPFGTGSRVARQLRPQ